MVLVIPPVADSEQSMNDLGIDIGVDGVSGAANGNQPMQESNVNRSYERREDLVSSGHDQLLKSGETATTSEDLSDDGID